MGRGWRGRKCWAVMRVARRVGGRGDSNAISVCRIEGRRRRDGGHTTPCFRVGEERLFGFFGCIGSVGWHWHFGGVVGDVRGIAVGFVAIVVVVFL